MDHLSGSKDYMSVFKGQTDWKITWSKDHISEFKEQMNGSKEQMRGFKGPSFLGALIWSRYWPTEWNSIAGCRTSMDEFSFSREMLRWNENRNSYGTCSVSELCLWLQLNAFPIIECLHCITLLWWLDIIMYYNQTRTTINNFEENYKFLL